MNEFIHNLGDLIPIDGNTCLSCGDTSNDLINGHICYFCNSITYIVSNNFNYNDKFKILLSTNNFLKNELIRKNKKKINKLDNKNIINNFIKKKKSRREEELNKFNKLCIKNKLDKRNISKGRFLIKRKYRNFGSIRYTKKQKLAKIKNRGYKGQFCKKL